MNTQGKKPSATFEEKKKPSMKKHSDTLGIGDYTGAEAKTDPAEIALVRKIDWRLMVLYCAFNGV